MGQGRVIQEKVSLAARMTMIGMVAVLGALVGVYMGEALVVVGSVVAIALIVVYVAIEYHHRRMISVRPATFLLMAGVIAGTAGLMSVTAMATVESTAAMELHLFFSENLILVMALLGAAVAAMAMALVWLLKRKR